VKLDVYFTPGELGAAELPGLVVVVDVLRATSTIVEALSNGARVVCPVATADEAARLAQGLGRDSALLCGERKGLPIEGFDLGNAPAEFTAERVSGRSLVMTTTNGTGTFLAVAERRAAAPPGEGTIVAASLLNLGAVVRFAADLGGSVAVVCAGREGRFALEDAACAGALVERLMDAVEGVEPNDAARAARMLADGHEGLAGLLARSAAGRSLEEIGRGEDVEFCGRVDRSDVVPRLRDRKLTLE
jgi:2-phosphosulfolactate phosphatase